MFKHSFLTTVLLLVSLVSAADQEWDYKGLTGPAHWGHLKPEFAQCDKGKSQSPIDLASNSMLHTDEFPELDLLDFSKITVNTTRHSILWIPNNNDEQRSITINGNQYSLAQFHVHTPSEHWIDGRYYDGEMHFVHRTTDGRIAVLGFLLEATDCDNPKWTDLLSKVPQKVDQTTGIIDVILETDEITQLLTDGYYAYQGSLTAPPCTEGVQWFVASKPLHMSVKQIKSMSNLIGFTSRPIQFNENVAPLPIDGLGEDIKEEKVQANLATVISHSGTSGSPTFAVSSILMAITAMITILML